jgi:xanthine/CO dehydrogenase XdhC/CoxF family maturation factor
MNDTRILLVGSGDVTAVLHDMTQLLDWQATVVDAAADVAAAVADLRPGDAVVVLSHDGEVDGPALAAALAQGVGCICAMGSRRTQQRRRDWLLEHGVAPDRIDEIRGPAGLDIGADTPAEIAVSILAEVIAVHRGAALGTRTEAAAPQRASRGPESCPGG